VLQLHTAFFNILAAGGYTFSITPDASQAPGSGGIQKAIDGFAVYALLACGAGFLLGVVFWTIGNHGGNEIAAQRGKGGTIISVGGAFLVGIAAVLLNFAFKLGGGG